MIDPSNYEEYSSNTKNIKKNIAFVDDKKSDDIHSEQSANKNVLGDLLMCKGIPSENEYLVAVTGKEINSSGFGLPKFIHILKIGETEDDDLETTLKVDILDSDNETLSADDMMVTRTMNDEIQVSFSNNNLFNRVIKIKYK